FSPIIRAQSGKVVAAQPTISTHCLGTALKLHGAADVSAPRWIILARKLVADGIERWMQDRAVQALVVVEHDQLPICLHRVCNLSIGSQFRHSPILELVRQIL